MSRKYCQLQYIPYLYGDNNDLVDIPSETLTLDFGDYQDNTWDNLIAKIEHIKPYSRPTLLETTTRLPRYIHQVQLLKAGLGKLRKYQDERIKRNLIFFDKKLQLVPTDIKILKTYDVVNLRLHRSSDNIAETKQKYSLRTLNRKVYDYLIRYMQSTPEQRLEKDFMVNLTYNLVNATKQITLPHSPEPIQRLFRGLAFNSAYELDQFMQECKSLGVLQKSNLFSSWTSHPCVAFGFMRQSLFGAMLEINASPNDVLVDTTYIDDNERRELYRYDQYEIILRPGSYKCNVVLVSNKGVYTRMDNSLKNTPRHIFTERTPKTPVKTQTPVSAQMATPVPTLVQTAQTPVPLQKLSTKPLIAEPLDKEQKQFRDEVTQLIIKELKLRATAPQIKKEITKKFILETADDKQFVMETIQTQKKILQKEQKQFEKGVLAIITAGAKQGKGVSEIEKDVTKKWEIETEFDKEFVAHHIKTIFGAQMQEGGHRHRSRKSRCRSRKSRRSRRSRKLFF